MTDEEFISAIRNGVIEANLSVYKEELATTASEQATDPYWRQLLAFYGRLEPLDRELLLRVMRQVMVDTVSSLLGVLDGATKLENVPDDIQVSICDERLDGDLQEVFLAAEEDEAL